MLEGRERKGHPSTSRLVETAEPHEYFQNSNHHRSTASTHDRKCSGKQTAGLVGKWMARDNVKHGIPQVSITMMSRRGNRERKPMCSREIGE